jgi:hypothetical protein
MGRWQAWRGLTPASGVRGRLKTLEIKLGFLRDLLQNYGCEAAPREVLFSFLVSGVATPPLAQYLSQNSSEPQQQNLYRLSKAVDEKCATVEVILKDQVRAVQGDAAVVSGRRS